MPAVSPVAGTARRGLAHPLGSHTPLSWSGGVRRGPLSPAGPIGPPQLRCQLGLAMGQSPQPLARAREPDELSRSYPHHHVDTSDRSQSWVLQPRDFAARPAPTDPYHRTPQPPGHTEPRYPRATRYDLDQPARDRNHDAQRPQVSAAVPPGGHNFAPKSRSVYQKRATAPPVRSRHPPVHVISDSDSSDAEARLATTQGSSPSRRYSSGIPTTQRPWVPGTSARVLRAEAGFYLSVRTSTLDVERPDLRLATPPRDFDNDREESLASTEDEPDYSFTAVIGMIRTFHNIEKPATATPAHTATAFD